MCQVADACKDIERIERKLCSPALVMLREEEVGSHH